MIRTLTIVEDVHGNAIDYTVNGSLPLDEAARALVIIAHQAAQSSTNNITAPINEHSFGTPKTVS